MPSMRGEKRRTFGNSTMVAFRGRPGVQAPGVDYVTSRGAYIKSTGYTKDYLQPGPNRHHFGRTASGCRRRLVYIQPALLSWGWARGRIARGEAEVERNFAGGSLSAAGYPIGTTVTERCECKYMAAAQQHPLLRDIIW